jgi:hypothetical protein
MLKFFRIPFGQSGDRAAIPDAADSSGFVSYTQGYGPDYQRQNTDPLSKNIERDKMNQAFFDATSAISELQSRGIPDFITSALNGGTPFSYAINALVRWTDGNVYRSLAAANTADPTDLTKWGNIGLPGELNLLSFIPSSLHAAIRDFTSTTDLTTYLTTAFAAADGRTLFVPAGLYPHNSLQVPKTTHLHLRGEFNSYDGLQGAVFKYLGTGIALQVGVDDGNPDTTGPNRGCRISGIHFTTTSGTTAVRAQNTALVHIYDCTVRNFAGKILDLRANVITLLYRNDVFGTLPASGNYCVWMDDEYFGNFVTKIEENHFGQANHAGRFSEGRSLLVRDNIIENVQPPTGKGVWELETNGYISNLSFRRNYYENHRGYVYGGSTFTGLVLNLEIEFDEAWGSNDAAHVNPGVGNLLRSRVLNCSIGKNFFVDASWNTQAGLGMASVFPTTAIFDPSQTITRDQVTGVEYREAIRSALQGTDLLKSAGDFSIITGGTPGTLSVAGSTQPSVNGVATSAPSGWTSTITGAVWNAVVDAVTGAWVCYSPGSGSTFALATKVISLTPVASVRYFVMTTTTKGWAAVRINGTLVLDTGASTPNYVSNVFKFSIPASAASFTVDLATNATASFWAEARIYEIGLAEFTEAGALGFAMLNAALRLLRRGIY